jgi:hypothetical protein
VKAPRRASRILPDTHHFLQRRIHVLKGRLEGFMTNAEKITIIARSFDVRWVSALEAYLEENGRKDAIDSIMNNRHQIAHGKDVGITIARASGYLHESIEVLEFIETYVRPD